MRGSRTGWGMEGSPPHPGSVLRVWSQPPWRQRAPHQKHRHPPCNRQQNEYSALSSIPEMQMLKTAILEDFK